MGKKIAAPATISSKQANLYGVAIRRKTRGIDDRGWILIQSIAQREHITGVAKIGRRTAEDEFLFHILLLYPLPSQLPRQPSAGALCAWYTTSDPAHRLGAPHTHDRRPASLAHASTSQGAGAGMSVYHAG